VARKIPAVAISFWAVVRLMLQIHCAQEVSLLDTDLLTTRQVRQLPLAFKLAA
jgi:hypothetical protein